MKFHSSPGFTFLEMLISISILAVISTAAIALFRENQQRYDAEVDNAAAVQNARVALDIISRSLRQAGNNPTSSIMTPLAYSANTLTISSDITGSVHAANSLDSTGDPDSQLTAAYELVTIQYDSSEKKILINSGHGEDTLAENINKLEFKFYDDTGAVTVDPTQASSVNVVMEALSALKDPQTAKMNSITLATTVFVRSKTHSPFH